jgi:hypothetical protein
MAARSREVDSLALITGWRATARIKADHAQDEQALQPTSGDLGPFEVTP